MRWYARPPDPRDVWTYSGVIIMNGLSSSLLYHWLFSYFLDAWVAVTISGFLGFGLVALLLLKMGFGERHSLIVTGGTFAIAITVWPSFRLVTEETAAVLLQFFGLAVSLTPFCRGMEAIRGKAHRKN